MLTTPILEIISGVGFVKRHSPFSICFMVLLVKRILRVTFINQAMVSHIHVSSLQLRWGAFETRGSTQLALAWHWISNQMDEESTDLRKRRIPFNEARAKHCLNYDPLCSCTSHIFPFFLYSHIVLPSIRTVVRVRLQNCQRLLLV